MSKQTRREFLEQSLLTAATAAVAGNVRPTHAAEVSKQSTSPNERLRVACIGVRGRGGSHLQHFGERKDCEIAAIVDVDEAVGRLNIESVRTRFGYAPKFY